MKLACIDRRTISTSGPLSPSRKISVVAARRGVTVGGGVGMGGSP